MRQGQWLRSCSKRRQKRRSREIRLTEIAPSPAPPTSTESKRQEQYSSINISIGISITNREGVSRAEFLLFLHRPLRIYPIHNDCLHEFVLVWEGPG